MGRQVRDRLIAVKGRFGKAKMLTLTVDRRNFGSPEEAWAYVTGRRLIPKLLAKLGITRWVWVLEFQQKTGDGWPHWHILVDVSELHRHQVDLKGAWALWGKTWGVGAVDLAKAPSGMTAEHAIFYITKYLLKQPDGGYPEWVLARHGIRFVQGSRALPALVSDAPPGRGSPNVNPGQDEAPPAPPAKRKPRRSFLDRHALCGLRCRIFNRVTDPTSGRTSHAYVGELQAKPADLVELSESGRLGRFKFFPQLGEHNNLEVVSNSEITRHDVECINRRLLRLNASKILTVRGEYRKNRILHENAYVRRREEEHV